MALSHALHRSLRVCLAAVLAVGPALALSAIHGPAAAAATFGPPTKLTFLDYPVDYLPHADQPFDIVVAITDANGMTVTDGTSGIVTLSVAAPEAPAAVLTCPGGLSRQTVTSGMASGTASFAGCTMPSMVDLSQTSISYGVNLIAAASNVVSTALPAPVIASASEWFNVTPTLRSIKLTASPIGAYFTWGQTTTLRVHFTRAGANQPIRIEHRNELVPWTKLADLTTDADGNASVSHRPSVNTSYRVVFAGNTELQAGRSDQAYQGVYSYAKQIPTQSTPRVIRRGTTVSFATTVRPLLPSVESARVLFRVYHRVAGLWKFASHRYVPVDAAGVARFSLRFGTRGEWYVRSNAMPRYILDPVSFPPVVNGSKLTPIARYSVR